MKNLTQVGFGFLINLKLDAPFSRSELVFFLEKHKIATRMLFAGNLTQAASLCNENA